MDEFDGIEIETATSVELAIIWLHGLGADANDFAPIVPELKLPIGVRYVFPHAPRRPVTINGGFVMRAWYDIAGLGPEAPEDERGICESAEFLLRLVEREVARGLTRERIVLAGFSQGGAIALHAGLSGPESVAGIVALSTYLPLARRHRASNVRPRAGPPVWMAHGRDDPMIPIAFAELSRERLIALGLEVEWHSYAMGHSVCVEELGDLERWLMRFC